MPSLVQVIFFTLSVIVVMQKSWAEPADYPHSIVVVTSNQYPVNPEITFKVYSTKEKLSVSIFNLDTVSDFKLRLGKGLPADETKARTIIEQRISMQGKNELDNELRTAYQGLSVAMQYGLDRYPAIIFDSRAVIYGITDLPLAIKKHRSWYKNEMLEVANHE